VTLSIDLRRHRKSGGGASGGCPFRYSSMSWSIFAAALADKDETKSSTGSPPLLSR
jgi:hypothetical protein